MERIVRDKLISFIKAAILSGLPGAVILTALWHNPAKGFVAGIYGGLLFGFGLLLYSMTQDMDGRIIYDKISEKEKMEIYTAATMFTGKHFPVSGRLYLSKNALRFYEMGALLGGKRLAYIPYETIEDITLPKKLNCIEILTTNGSTVRFCVHGRGEIASYLRKKSGLRRMTIPPLT